jgi:hypothetical protein
LASSDDAVYRIETDESKMRSMGLDPTEYNAENDDGKDVYSIDNT